MKKVILTSLMALFAIAACRTILSAQAMTEQATLDNKHEMNISTEKQAIEKMLFSYRDALNKSDVTRVLPLYTADGVFMPSSAPSAVGLEQVKASYEYVFKTIQLHIEFYIDEIVINGDNAFARTTSKGTTLIRASGQTVPEENRELFVLKKDNGQWKIARYMFNKMK